MINVAYISHFSDLKMGGQRSMSFLIEHLDKSRFKPYAVMPQRGELSEKLESYGCECFFIPLYSIKPKFLYKLPKEYIQLRTFIKEQDIDILHPDYQSDVFMSWLAKRGTKAKLIWHVRWNQRYSKDKFYEKIVDAIICVSEGAKARFSDLPEIQSKCRVIYNGVDCELFQPVEDKNVVRQELNLPLSKFILMFVGIIKEGKGIFDLLNAMLELKSNSLELPQLVVVGSFPDDITKSTILRFVEENNLTESISFVPQQKNIQKWMQAADSLIIPSHEGNEGMPRVLYEAMACGTAGIGSDTSGVNEAITKDSGLLVNEKSPADIANVVNKLMRNPELLSSLQLNGRQRALNVFDIRQHAKNVENFYLKVLNQNPD